jgi:rare lipoprotein A
VGSASWYGVPYHGRRAANGEIYDMYKLTAAHRTLPFETIVRVTNLKNGKQTEVRITDRGPFVEGRHIDLSLAAARAIDMVGDGIARVRLELVKAAPPLPNAFTVQVGAFRQKENATRLRQRLERNYGPVFVFEYDSPSGLFYRVRVGRVPSEKAAERLAARLQEKEQLTTFIVRLDEPQPPAPSSGPSV